MNEAFQFLLRYGYAVLFGLVFAEQIGLPIPAVPVLLAMGALAGTGKFSLVISLAVAVVAAVLSDLIWYQLGRHRGYSVLNLLCRISLEPDSCVRRTENVFGKYGARSLLFAKFVPGLSTAAPPLAGMFGMRLPWFLAWDGAGTLLWVGLFVGTGYLFSAQLERVSALAFRLGHWLIVLIVGSLAAYIGWKYAQRHRFIRSLRIARITPEELMQRLEAGEEVVVVDLRHSIEFEADNVSVPRALRILPEELERRHHEVPRDREVVLYCT